MRNICRNKLGHFSLAGGRKKKERRRRRSYIESSLGPKYWPGINSFKVFFKKGFKLFIVVDPCTTVLFTGEVGRMADFSQLKLVAELSPCWLIFPLIMSGSACVSLSPVCHGTRSTSYTGIRIP